MLLELLLLQRSINKLTVNDFNFDIGTKIGTLNPNEVKLIHTTKKINNTTEYTISVPCVNSSFDNNFTIKVLSRPQIQHITLSDLAIYEEYKKSNSEYDLIETEVFYIGAEFKNRIILDDIIYYCIYSWSCTWSFNDVACGSTKNKRTWKGYCIF